MLINGSAFIEMLISAANALENSKEKINDLNVFPVPDGDTGTNMSASLAPIKEISDVDNIGVGKVSEIMADLVLKASRGNSGAILAMFFCGFADSIKTVKTADTVDFSRGFSSGVAKAYKAVSQPVEGTMLTVMRGVAEEAEKICNEYSGRNLEFFVKLGERAESELKRTPDLLAVLKQACVVDAGGYGFVIILKAIIMAIANKPVQLENGLATQDKANFSNFDVENITFSYCTECVIDKNESYKGGNYADELKQFIMGIGDSVVFMENDDIIKFHVHTNHPGSVIEKALSYGQIEKLDVNNMRKQYAGLVSNELAVTFASQEKQYGFVSICSGEGVKDIFKGLMVDEIVDGGKTMNCNTEAIFEGIKRVNAKTIFVLPNNKNIYMCAKQAADMCKDKTVLVIPTQTICEGMNAIIAFDADVDSDINFNEMKLAAENTVTLSYSKAVRACDINGVKANKGDYVGLRRNELISSADSLIECVKKSSGVINNCDFLTVIYSGELTMESVDLLLKSVVTNEDAEIVIKKGLQPLYDLIISAE